MDNGESEAKFRLSIKRPPRYLRFKPLAIHKHSIVCRNRNVLTSNPWHKPRELIVYNTKGSSHVYPIADYLKTEDLLILYFSDELIMDNFRKCYLGVIDSFYEAIFLYGAQHNNYSKISKSYNGTGYGVPLYCI